MLDDADLGRLARVRLIAAMDAKQSAKEAGRTKAREKLGTPIEIDGVRYASRAQARAALGMSHQAFIKKFGYAS